MKFLRWTLAVLIAAWTLWNAFPLVLTVAHKLGKLPASAEGEKYVPLMDATQWWQVGLWALFTVLMLTAAWRLFRGASALGVYILAVVANVAMWWFFQSMPTYQSTFTAQELQFDYYIMAGEVVVGLLIWILQRRKPA